MLDLDYTRERMRKYRKEHQLTQAQFAEKLDVSLNHVGNLERGNRDPSLEMFFRLAEEMGMTADELAGNGIQKGTVSARLQNLNGHERDVALKVLNTLLEEIKSTK